MLCAALYPNVVQVYIHYFPVQNKKNQASVKVYALTLVFVVQVRAPQGNYKMTSKGAMKMQPKANELRFMTKDDGPVHVHPSSVNYTVRQKGKNVSSCPAAILKGASALRLFCAPGSPLRQPLPGVPREGEDEPHLHQGLQHGLRLPAGAVRRRASQRGAPKGRVCRLPRRWLDPIRCRFSSGQRAENPDLM